MSQNKPVSKRDTKPDIEKRGGKRRTLKQKDAQPAVIIEPPARCCSSGCYRAVFQWYKACCYCLAGVLSEARVERDRLESNTQPPYT